MLKLSMRAGEYLMIGENVKLVFLGGSGNNAHIMVDAPKEIAVVRSRAAEKRGTVEPNPYHRDAGLSPQAQREIRRILMEDKNNRGNNGG